MILKKDISSWGSSTWESLPWWGLLGICQPVVKWGGICSAGGCCCLWKCEDWWLSTSQFIGCRGSLGSPWECNGDGCCLLHLSLALTLQRSRLMSLLFMFLLATSWNLIYLGVPWLRMLKQSREHNSRVGLSVLRTWPETHCEYSPTNRGWNIYFPQSVDEILCSNHLYNKAYSARTFTISDFVAFGPYQACKQFSNELFLFFFSKS